MNTILLVDDDRQSLEVLGYVLEGQGYRVLRAESALEAEGLSNAYRGRIDLLVTDGALRSDSGQEMAARLCTARPGMKILYISGHSSVDLIRKGQLHWKSPFLRKPFTASEFVSQVRQMIERPEQCAA